MGKLCPVALHDVSKHVRQAEAKSDAKAKSKDKVFGELQTCKANFHRNAVQSWSHPTDSTDCDRFTEFV